MGKLNRTCCVCNTKYSYCYTCPSDLYEPSWKVMFHDENCKNIFNILGKEGQGLITTDEAKEMLSQCNLENKETFTENIKNHINKVLGINKESNNNTTISTDDIVINDHVEVIKEDETKNVEEVKVEVINKDNKDNEYIKEKAHVKIQPKSRVISKQNDKK